MFNPALTKIVTTYHLFRPDLDENPRKYYNKVLRRNGNVPWYIMLAEMTE